MKRSEMLQLMKDTFSAAALDPDTEYADAMDQVLATMEEAGMILCEKRNLGDIGYLWTPVDFEEEK